MHIDNRMKKIRVLSEIIERLSHEWMQLIDLPLNDTIMELMRKNQRKTEKFAKKRSKQMEFLKEEMKDMNRWDLEHAIINMTY